MEKLEKIKIKEYERLIFESFDFDFPEPLNTCEEVWEYFSFEQFWGIVDMLALVPPQELVRYLRSFGMDATLRDVVFIMRSKKIYTLSLTTPEGNILQGYLAEIKCELAKNFIKNELIIAIEPFEALKRHFLFLKARKNSEAHFLLEQHYGKHKLLGHLNGKELAEFLNKIYPNIPEVKAREIQKALSGNKFRRRRARMKPRDEEFKLGYYVVPMSKEAEKFIKDAKAIVEAYY